MNKILMILFSLLMALSIGACDSTPNAERTDRQNVERQQEVYQTAQPVPSFDYSLERAVAIQLYEARNQEVATHTVWRSDTGVIEGHCASVGYPLPYDTSLTNPLQEYHRYRSAGAVAIEQPEPNGLYSSHNSIATWVRCSMQVNGRRVVAPVYIESRVTAYPFPVEINMELGTVVPLGAAPTVTITDAR